MGEAIEGLRTFLYDSSGKDRRVDLTADTVRHLPKDQLVWIDVDTASDAAVKQVTTLLGLDEAALTGQKRLPVQQRGEYFSFTLPALAEPSRGAELVDLTCAASSSWLVTAHHGGLQLRGRLRRARACRELPGEPGRTQLPRLSARVGATSSSWPWSASSAPPTASRSTSWATS